MAQSFCRRFLNFVNVFMVFHYYLPLVKNMALQVKKLEFQSLRDALCQLNFVNVFSVFLNYLPWEKGVALQLNKFKCPLPKDALCQVWLKLAK